MDSGCKALRVVGLDRYKVLGSGVSLLHPANRSGKNYQIQGRELILAPAPDG
jgi:hypothetical protein